MEEYKEKLKCKRCGSPNTRKIISTSKVMKKHMQYCNKCGSLFEVIGN